MSTSQAATATSAEPTVVTPQEWLVARKELLAKEKEITRLRDDLARRRRELPWERVQKDYAFETAEGRRSLAELFAGRSQLVIYHFMFGPEWPEGCPSCSMVADHLGASVAHLAQRDVTLLVASRAPLDRIRAFQERMGWTFPWVSSHGSDFNRDYGVFFTPEQMASGRAPYNYAEAGFPSEEAPGVSVFAKDASGLVFHTYSTYGRGVEDLLGIYNVLDWTPQGRNEDGLPYPMAWVRHHDRYETKAAAPCCAHEERA